MYSFESRVRYSECDTQSRLTLPALINYLQDASTFHSEDIGHGVDYMRKNHFCWVITSWQIVVHRTPRYLDHIRVSTWCPEVGSITAKRNFTIETTEGERLVDADSLWAYFDTERGRAVRVPASENVFQTEDEALPLAPLRRKIKPEGTPHTLAPITVTKHHLDTNRHVNNGQYVQMATDAVRELEDGFESRQLLAQYRTPATLGDTIVPVCYREGDNFCVDLTDGDGTRYAICRLIR